MLIRFDPFREFDRVMEQAWRGTTERVAPMDAYRRGDEFVVHLDLPGADPEALDVTVEQNVLTVVAERRPLRADGDEIVAEERPQGRVTRRLMLGEALDAERISARFEHGVLTLTIPVAEQAKPRKVAVTAAGTARELTGATAS